MEAAAASSLSVPFTNPKLPLRQPRSIPSRPLITPSPLAHSLCLSFSTVKQQLHLIRKERSCSVVRSTPTENPTLDSSEKWLLQPVGDGDYRHIGFKVPLPNAFEIASNAVTVGRVSGKADVVIPVATVSGLHARLEKKDGALLVTDLGSTNGTFIDDKKLTPGFAIPVSPGSCIIFGDTNLAIFRVSKIDVSEPSIEADESPVKAETNVTSI